MLDSNVLIAHIDRSHKFHPKVRKSIQDHFINGIAFYYSLPCLLEMKNYWKRKLISECIETHLSEGKKLFSRFEKLYLEYRDANKGEYLYDNQIKKLRQTLEKVHRSQGKQYWFSLCRQAMQNQFTKLDDFLSQSSIKYARFYDEDVFLTANKSNWPKWEDVDSMIEKYGLASNDAAIINMVNKGHNIDSIVSNDGDVLFAISNGCLQPSIKIFTFLDPALFQ